jgi:hypothetical protein
MKRYGNLGQQYIKRETDHHHINSNRSKPIIFMKLPTVRHTNRDVITSPQDKSTCNTRAYVSSYAIICLSHRISIPAYKSMVSPLSPYLSLRLFTFALRRRKCFKLIELVSPNTVIISFRVDMCATTFRLRICDSVGWLYVLLAILIIKAWPLK